MPEEGIEWIEKNVAFRKCMVCGEAVPGKDWREHIKTCKQPGIKEEFRCQ